MAVWLHPRFHPRVGYCAVRQRQLPVKSVVQVVAGSSKLLVISAAGGGAAAAVVSCCSWAAVGCGCSSGSSSGIVRLGACVRAECVELCCLSESVSVPLGWPSLLHDIVLES